MWSFFGGGQLIKKDIMIDSLVIVGFWGFGGQQVYPIRCSDIG